MIELIKQAKYLIKSGNVKKIGGPGTMGQLYEVGEHTVRIFTKPGRLLFTCDCYNASHFGHNQFCIHKASIILFESMNNFEDKIKKIIQDYNKFKDCKLKVDPLVVLDDLEKLRRAR